MSAAPARRTRIEAHVTVEASGALPVDLLAGRSGLSKQRVKQAMNKGAVWLERGGGTRRLRRVRARLDVGDVLHLYHDEHVLSMSPPTPTLVADEGAYTVWDKPPGMLSQGSKWGDHCALPRYAEQHLEPERNAFTVHRIDRAARGLLLVAHEKKAAAALSAMFQARRVEKRYRVTVNGRVCAPLTLDAPLDGRESLTRVVTAVHDEDADRSELEVEIVTGRKHQIRRHLADHGHPVVGDRLYGSAETGADLALTAARIAFACPITGRPRCYELPAG